MSLSWGVFPDIILLLILHLIPLWTESIVWMISILLNLLRFILCSKHILINILCSLENSSFSTQQQQENKQPNQEMVGRPK